MSKIKRHCRIALLFVAAWGISDCPSADAADSWSSFQNGGTVSFDRDGKSASLQLSSDIAWQTELAGYGQSSPVVWDDNVYVTSVEGANKDTYHITAYRLKDGTDVWQYDVPNASPRESTNYVSRAAPTPAVDANGLVCFFEGGNLVALTHSGKIRWQRNLAEEFGEIGARHGLSASVEQDDDAAYIWVERSEQPYVLSVSKQTGETRWKVAGVSATSWASPRLVPVEGGQHLVLSAIGSFVGLDPHNGKQLWRLDGISGNSTPTPVPLGDGRFLIGATVGRGEAGGGRAAESNGVVAIKQSAKGDWQAEYVWRAARATSSFGSPIAHHGVAYFVNRSGVLYGLDLESGKELFTQRLAGSIWATPLGLGDRVFFFAKDGRVNMLATGDDSPKISTWESLPADAKAPSGEGDNPFAGSTLYGATWCNNTFLLRRGDRLFAVKTAQE